MDPIERLSSLFEKFPGIGPRQARRFVQYLLASPSSSRGELSELIKRLGAETSQCKRCYRWFVKQSAKATGPADLCPICASASRDSSIIFVVEKDADIENVERSGFRGLYFVLGGTIPLASEDIPKHVRVLELLKRVQFDTAEKLKEIILGLSATTEGDHTRLILGEKLRESNIKISALGRGLSTGSELEYADPDTIASALSSRN
jgi:recombination protein RecR